MSLKIGLIGVDQICFTGDKDVGYQRGRQALSRLAGQLDFTLSAYENTIITRGQAEEAAAFFTREGIDFLLVQNASYAAGETILPLAKLGLPIGLWAIPEPRSNGVLPLNSFCGVNMYAGIITHYLKHHNLKYKYFFGHADDPRFVERLSITVRALTAIKKLRQSKVALVGGIAPGFNDLYFDERIIEKKLGVNVQRNHEYGEIRQRALSYGDKEVNDCARACLDSYCDVCEGAEENMALNARFFMAYRDFARDNQYDALAISCWPKIQDEFGLCACHSIAGLNQIGVPAACEGDMPGALGMLLLRYLSGGKATTLMDLVSFDESDDTMQLWHCGPTAADFANKKGVSLKTLTENTNPEGTAQRYLRYIHDMVFQSGEATIALFCNDFEKMFVTGGSFIDRPKDTYRGSAGWLGSLRVNDKPVSVRDMIHTILTRGIQHHFPVVYGNYTKELIETAAWLGFSRIDAMPYTDYYAGIE